MSLVKGYEKDKSNAIDRIMATVLGKPTDRIPIFPMIDSLCSKLLNLSIKKYYSSAKSVIEGQSKLQELLNLDYVSNFYYLAIESEIFGMNTLFFEGGSPNTGEPIAKTIDFFTNNEIPTLNEHPAYQKTITTTKGLTELYKGKKPILSVQTGPFSFPSLLMGASAWFESILINPDKIQSVLDFSLKFGEQWAKEHIEAGADILVLVDGLATATSIPREMFEELVIPLYQRITRDLKVPIVFYTAGGNILPFADLFNKTGVIGTFPSANDDLEELKKKSEGKYTLFGNVNNLELGDWTLDFMEHIIRETIKIGKPNGRYVLATQHMIPHNVSIEKIGEFISLALKYAYF